MPYALQVMDGQRAGEILPLVAGVVSIGRSLGDLLLEDTEVSSRHCTVQLNAGELLVVDHSSRNGTFLNGQKIDRSRIRVGDALQVGGVSFRLIEWPNEPEFADPTTLIKSWCEQLENESRNQSGQSIAMLVAKEIELCQLDVQLKLTIESKDGRIVNYVVPVGEVVLGRAGAVPLLAEDDEASRKHARVYVSDDGHLMCEDVGSANGTYINEERLTGRRRLRDNDVVRLGRTKIRFACLLSEFSSPIPL